MDRFDSLNLLVRVVERQSFSHAAADLGIPRSSATLSIQRLEERLGVRLLQRTTRHVVPTIEGELFYRRAKAILAEMEDAEAALTNWGARGLLRIHVHGPMARTFIFPKLPEFLERHPGLSLDIGEGDRYVDIVREGFDCVVRAGEITDAELVARRLGLAREVTLASPAYIARHGLPNTIEELDGHKMIGFVSSRTGQVLPLEFSIDGGVRNITLPCRITVTNSDSYAALARLGLGLIQVPRYRNAEDLAAGRLVEVLPQHPPLPTPISVLYPKNRQLSPRVRVFIDWLVEEVAPKL